MPRVRIADLDVAYSEAGEDASGELPLVLVHGLAEDRTSWTRTQADLTQAHSYAYDLRGHGQTSLGTPTASLEQLGRDLIAFLEEVSGPAVVVGFSLGGTIALWAAGERPDLVRRAVVLGTSSVVGRSAVGFYDGRIELAADTSSPGFAEALAADTRAAVFAQLAPADFEALVASRLRAVGDGGGYINASRAMAALNAEPLTPRLAHVSVPVHVVGGSHDAFCPEKAARIIVDALPHPSYEVIDGAGHLMNVDQPAAVTGILAHAAAA